MKNDDDSAGLTRDIAPFGVRMPAALKERVQAAAKVNNRSMNAEIVAVLEEKFPAPLSTQSELAIVAAAAAMFHPRRADGEFSSGYRSLLTYAEERFNLSNPVEKLQDEWDQRANRDPVTAQDIENWFNSTFLPWKDDVNE